VATSMLKLLPGVDSSRSPVLNQAGISSCNLIRLWPSRTGEALVQKLGGWKPYYPNAMPSIVRQIWPWEDENHNQYLGIGCITSDVSGVGAPLMVLNNGSLNTITPIVRQDNVSPSVTVTTTSSTAFINDTGSNINSYTAVFVTTHIAVDGIVIFGFYQCAGVGPDQFSIQLTDILGNAVFPAQNETNSGTVAEFTTTNNSSVVTVALNNHGYTVGSTYPCLVRTTVGGLTLFGNYLVQSVIDANTFTIQVSNSATSGTSVYINGGNAQYDFYIGIGPLPQGTGYGVGGYGVGGYGTGTTPVEPTGSNITASDWSLDNWGDIFVAVANGLQFGPDATVPIGSPVYLWNPLSATPQALALAAGPAGNDGCLVAMPQRQIVCWGSTFTGIQDHLLLRWCDVNNYNQWIARPTNQAGSYRISKGSRIVGCIQAPNQILVFTDLSVWSMLYIGQPLIYGFNEIGSGCGLIAPKAVANFSGTVFWMSQTQFFSMAPGSAPAPLLCPVWDDIFQLMDLNNVNKIRVAPNSQFNEIAWYFTSINSPNGEPDMYVKFNTLVGASNPGGGWDYGTLGRSAWTNQSVLGPPIGADPVSLFLFQHETSNDANGQAMNSFFRTGWFEIGDGQMQTFVDFILPDAIYGMQGAAQNATILITFYVAQYPGDTPLVFGPYTTMAASTYINTRFRGRLVSIEVSSQDTGTWWRSGGWRYRWVADGRF
jgi:hypothetical protein